MDFSFTEEQSMLRDTVASYLADHYDFDKRRAVVTKEPGWRPEVWKAFAEELGILGAPFSEEMAKTSDGHKRAIRSEFTLVSRNANASAKVVACA